MAQEQGSRRGDQALSAIGQGSLVQVEYDAGITDQPPFALLIESLDICVDHAFGSDPTFLAVIHLGSNQAEPVITAKIAFLAVVQNPVWISAAALALMIPDRLLSRLALVRRRLESVTNLPPRLSTASWLLSLSAPALDRVASWLYAPGAHRQGTVAEQRALP